MKINISRTLVKGEITEGHLYIDGQEVCQTLENTRNGLDAGLYVVNLVKCRQYARKMICLSRTATDGLFQSEACLRCEVNGEVFSNTLLPNFCPMIKPGNGIHNRLDGSLLVGRRNSLGSLVHPKPCFDALYDRIRKSKERGREVTLEIQ